MADKPVLLDERVVAVAYKSSHIAGIILLFGVLIDATVRALLYRQACWDLFALVIGSGLVATIYQRAKHVETLPNKSKKLAILVVLLSAIIAAVVAAVVALISRHHR